MAEKKGKNTAVATDAAPADTAQASAPVAKVRRISRLSGKDRTPSKPTSVFSGSVSRAVTQAEKARSDSGARPSSRTTPSTSSSYGVRLRPQDTPLHRRRPASPAVQAKQAEQAAEAVQAKQAEQAAEAVQAKQAEQAAEAVQAKQAEQAAQSTGKSAKAKPAKAAKNQQPKAQPKAQAPEKPAQKAKSAFTPISLDREELPDDAGDAFWSAQEAESLAGQNAAPENVQEDAQKDVKKDVKKAGQQAQDAGRKPGRPASRDGGALPWDADDPASGEADQRGEAGLAQGKSADSLDARGLFGQSQDEAGSALQAKPAAEAGSGGDLPWEQEAPSAGASDADARDVDARGLFGQDQRQAGEGPIDTKTFFTRAGAEDLRIDYGTEQAQAESGETQDGKEAGLPEGFGMFQDDGPAVSLERLAGAQAEDADAPHAKIRRAGQAKAAQPAKPEPPLDTERPKIRRSQGARDVQTPRQGVHEGRVYRDSRRARDGQRSWSSAPVTMSAAEMAETAAHGGQDPQSGSFRGLVENLQGGAAREETKRGEHNARIISVPSSARAAKRQPEDHAAPAPQAQASPAASGTPAAAKTAPGGPRVLICWLGKVDIGAAMRRDHINPGPVRMLIEHSDPFDHVILLTTQNPNVLENYRAWLAPCVSEPVLDIWRTQVHDLADHGLICTAIIEAVEHAIREFSLPATGEGITFHLSPGTPATHAMLLLLAASRYKGVRLVQTKINGTEQASEVLDIHVPDVVLKDASDDGLLPSFVSHEPLPMPAAAPEAQAEDAEQAPEADSRAHFGHGARAGRKRPMAHAFPSPRIQSDITDPYEGLRPPTNAPNMQTAPKEGDPPTISEALGEVYDKMQRISTMSVPVLLLGESGTGKSRLARFIHDWSGRSGKFICVDCAGLSDEVFISELFGQKQGDSPCAWRSREGAFRLANGGTLFLENVDALSASQQSMLLRMLAPIGETVVQLPGGAGSRAASSARMRIIASAGDALVAKMQSGEFRSDLFYRLSGVAARLPSVREYAPEEKENMLRSFFVNLQHRMGRFWSFSGDAWQALLDEDWPGNLREIGRMLQQICLLSSHSDTISREEVLQQLKLTRQIVASANKTQPSMEPTLAAPGMDQFGLTGIAADGTLYAPEGLGQIGAGASPGEEAKERVEREFFAIGSGANLEDRLQELRMAKITEALNEARGNRSEAARLLGMSYAQLSSLLQQKKG